MIPIKETFLSFQGEGYFAGQASYFIRTQGCDIGCHWCDEPASWEFKSGINQSLSNILKDIKKSNVKNVIVTGGEPLIHDLSNLTNEISKNNFSLHLETSGSYALTGNWNWITLSPKKIRPPLKSIYSHTSELKVVIYNNKDFEWALEQERNISKFNNDCLLYLQPEWSRKEIMQQQILDFISKNPRWKLSLQMHKYLNVK
ncbi:MAG: 7-carboxy-7-deazaguanine synthase QueE [Flavobacteriales bacterium]|nr:7-carboxy-7-deazaguanine synthase QueE [Flavobacteriales bacterium]|tara:strand:+ start:6924 stop:7526 length:603 start_codon:yes stop_codon:yes gene_type:complete